MANGFVSVGNLSNGDAGTVRLLFNVYTDTGLAFEGNPYIWISSQTYSQNLDAIRQSAIDVVSTYPGAPTLQKSDIIIFLTPN